MQKKRFVLSIFCGIFLLAVIVTGMVNILNKNPTAKASEITQKEQATLKDQPLHYPNPSDQSTLPASVKVTGAGEKVVLRAFVTQGEQIYECKASTTAQGGFAWQLQAPFAFLKADDGTNVIHSTGPTWLYTKDGSAIMAKVGQFTMLDGSVVPASATPNVNAIPWLRLDVTVHQGSVGLFSKVDQVQRLFTKGGIAPHVDCNQRVANKHVLQPVEYTAEYVFWSSQS